MTYTTLKQLVVETGNHSLTAVDNADSKDVDAFENVAAGRYVPRLGSVDLMRLAAGASRFGYYLVGVTIRDRAMHALPDADEERIVEDLVPALREGDFAAAQSLLRGERGPMSVVSVELAGDKDDDDVHVGRMGTFTSTSDSSFEKLMKPAWEKLHLS